MTLRSDDVPIQEEGERRGRSLSKSKLAVADDSVPVRMDGGSRMGKKKVDLPLWLASFGFWMIN